MAENKQDILNNILDFDSVNDNRALIELETIDENTNELNSPRFLERDALLKDLFKSDEHSLPERIQIEEIHDDVNILNELTPTVSADRIILSGWKNVENISSRLIENCGEHVVLECLIDKEAEVYEERIFRASLFNGYNLELGNLFYLRFFERDNEMKMEVNDGTGIVSENDFPTINFTEMFKNSKLFKK